MLPLHLSNLPKDLISLKLSYHHDCMSCPVRSKPPSPCMVFVRFAGVPPCSGCFGWVCSGLLLGFVKVWLYSCSALVLLYMCDVIGGWWELGNYCNSFPPPPNFVTRYVSNDKEKNIYPVGELGALQGVHKLEFGLNWPNCSILTLLDQFHQ